VRLKESLWDNCTRSNIVINCCNNNNINYCRLTENIVISYSLQRRKTVFIIIKLIKLIDINLGSYKMLRIKKS